MSFPIVQSFVWNLLIFYGSFRLNSLVLSFELSFRVSSRYLESIPLQNQKTRSWSSVMEVKTSLQCPSKIKWKHPAMASTRRIHGISMFTVAVDSVDVSVKVQVFKTRPSKDRIFEQLQSTSNPLKLSRVDGKRSRWWWWVISASTMSP